jgi:hypothetical protein
MHEAELPSLLVVVHACLLLFELRVQDDVMLLVVLRIR